MKITESLENYLEEIYESSLSSKDVRVTDLAIKMNVSKASVNKALKKLKEQGLVNHEKYGTFELTEEGKQRAIRIHDTHIILKSFLVDIIGVDEEVAEEEACAVEHCLSVETVEKFKKFVDSIEDSYEK